MGFWLNNFVEFEKNKRRENRLILNFYYFPDEEENFSKEPISIKIFTKKNLKIPTSFVSFSEIERIVKILDKRIKNYTLKKKEIGKNKFVLELEVPYEPGLLEKLPGIFQKGNYDKFLRFKFYPERKVALDAKIEKIFLEISKFRKTAKKSKKKLIELNSQLKEIDEKNAFYFDPKTKDYEIYLNSLKGIHFLNEFLGEKELQEARKLYIDIEKPLWKKEEEKELIKKRKQLYERLSREGNNVEQIKKEISELERKLTIQTEFGEVKLYEDLFDAKISFVSTIWENINGKTIKELYVWDPHGEIKEKKFGDFILKKFKTEKELVQNLTTTIKERKPLICWGHNQVYDVMQLRFAAEKTKAGKFDIAIKDIQPRRDFVRDFYQRLKEEMIYLDTLWLSRIFFPFLMQRSLGRSLRLEDVAKFFKLDFEKKISHEDLRYYEIKRLIGKEEERRTALFELLEYTSKDIETIYYISKKIPLSLLLDLKKIMPSLTLTELAFSTTCAKKYFEKKYFELYSHLEYYGYKQKEREDERKEFKKKFIEIKKRLLEWAKIKIKREKHFLDLYQIYLPFEEWIKEAIFAACPEFKTIYEKLEKGTTNRIEENIEKFGFLQFIKILAEQILTDFYFIKKYKRIYEKAIRKNTLFDDSKEEKINLLERKIKDEEIKKDFENFYTRLEYAEKQFRNLYPFLNKEMKSKLFFKKSKDLFETLFSFYSIVKNMEENFDEKRKKVLKGFITNFEKLKEIENNLTKTLKISGEVLFFFYCKKKAEKKEIEFYKKYNIKAEELTKKIKEAYQKLKRELEAIGEVTLVKGDYLFLKPFPGKEEKIENSKLFYTVGKIRIAKNI